MYVCSCFGVTEAQVRKHAEDGACTPRQIASACKAGTDCGSCVRRIQAILGRDRPALTALPGERLAGARGTARPAATGPQTIDELPRPFPRSA
ncbi:(2Fe-2S)-binding protein [Streptomyces fuscichromogenes]|uniref:Bacterioferritin-associated ferredoxin n=1 Tax=Streptomyces fuscichromogenes TaxID=1324013 RepID=A0A917X6R5_9ACTN|nr:(2Fe-2S)-binding protein [Streptomyces fuscichromogenes]GGM87603.1 hypothetical protein GCM10011578_003370 [Streptomyces fuscichromogenes]